MLCQPCQSDVTHTERCSTLVLGLGNILLRDEGLGVHAVRALGDADVPADVELLDGGTSAPDLLDVLADRQRLIVIDAIDSDVPAGTVLRLTPDDLAPRTDGIVSLHDLGLLELLAAARHLGTVPQEVIIFGVKPHDVQWGLELSPEIDRLLPKITKLVLKELKKQPRDRGPSAAQSSVDPPRSTEER